MSDEFIGSFVDQFRYIIILMGACLGSFANVFIYRWPKGESVIHPRSKCPKCSTQIKFYDNLPIISWLILRGKCRQCKTPISARYPIVELLMAMAFGFVYDRFGMTWTALEYYILLFGLITVSFIDLDHFLLPDIFTLSGIGLGLLGSILNPGRTFLDSLAGVVVGGGFLWAIAYLYFAIRKEEGMGGGDVKLLAWLGAILGWKAIPFVILSSSIIGSLFGVYSAVRAKSGMKTAIPFGPFLALGGVLYIFGGQAIGDWYLNLFIVHFE